MESGVFPFRESSTAKITSHALAKDCLIYTTNVRLMGKRDCLFISFFLILLQNNRWAIWFISR